MHNRDHREVIYNDMYHNAMWANVGDINDKLVWVKYPKNGLMITDSGDANNAGLHGWIDVDRQFIYGRGYAGGMRGRGVIFGLECGITVAYSQYGGANSDFSITDDGIVWQDITVRGANPWQETPYHFSENGLCWIHIGDRYYDRDYIYIKTFIVGVIQFSKNESTGKFEVTTRQFSYIQDASPNVQFVCNTKQGCIIHTTLGGTFLQDGTAGASNPTYWHIDNAGVMTQKHTALWTNAPIFSNLYVGYGTQPLAYAKVGNRCFVIASVQNQINRYSGDRYYRIYALYSFDQGETWTGEKVFEYYASSGVLENVTMRINMYVRDGEVFAFWASSHDLGGKTHLLSTYTGTQWDEIALPTWLDVPVINEGGAGVSTTPSLETLRIAVDPLNTNNYNITLMDLLGDPRFDTNLRCGSVMYRDGKMVKVTDDVMWFYFQTGSWRVFFDNRYLAENSRAFAYQYAYWINTRDIPDYIQNGDYCVPYDPVPFDPYQYPFWDYYIWVSETQEYIKVARITLPYYSEYYLVVVEYLPTTGANNVLYKVPRYNV